MDTLSSEGLTSCRGFPLGVGMGWFRLELGGLVALLACVSWVNGATPESSKPRVVSVRMQTISGAKFEQVPFQQITRVSDKKEAKSQILASDYSCAELDELWVAAFTLKRPGARIYKANCALGVSYQVTVIDGRGFVKPWNGVMLGD